MFDLGASELLLTVIVAIIVIGPKDLPRALRTAGGWLGKIRRVSGHFRSGIEEMIRQAELEDMEKKWREKNEAIMREQAAGSALPAPGAPAPASAEAAVPPTGAGAPDAQSVSYSDDPYGDVHPMISPPPAEAPAEGPPSSDVHAAADANADTASPELPLASPKAQP